VTEQRIPDLPSVPTFREAGLDLVYDAWFGIMAPAGVPKDVVAKLNRDIVAILKTPDIADKIKKQYAVVVTDTPAEFDKRIREETAKLTEIFKEATN
jgi:tripartite-type tricarboxylate transporter receptor subunit TctC